MTKESTLYFEYGSSGNGELQYRHHTVNTNVMYENTDDMDNSIDGLSIQRENLYENDSVPCKGHSVSRENTTTVYAQLAEIQTTACSTDITKVPTRRTRQSDHPILCISKESDLSDVIKGVDSEGILSTVSQDDFASYENTRTRKYLHDDDNDNAQNRECVSDRRTRSNSELTDAHINPENLYENTDFGTVSETTSDSSHVYENFEDKLKSHEMRMSLKSTMLNEAPETESLYEHLDIVYGEMSPPAQQKSVSKPIDIVYTSIDFGARKCSPSPGSVGSSSMSSSFGSLERPELRRCTSYCYGNAPLGVGKPPELPERGSGSFTKRSRPRSCHINNLEGTQITDFGLGQYTGTLVGSCIISKTSPKSVQKIIGDYLAREKKERSKSVSFQVTSESICLSYNVPPWWALAKNSLEDIGCITTYSANNKTALGYTISKPGEDTRLFVIHCSDADQIKDGIIKYFHQPAANNSLSRWFSMGALSTPNSGKSRSLPRMSARHRQNNEIASFDELVYIGSHKVKKSYLDVRDNVVAVLDHRDSKQYIVAKIELYRDAIHLKDGKKDRLLDIHQLEWILCIGVFDEDRRYFGYISSKAFQGSKTRTYCHVFRCNSVGLACQIMETMRKALRANHLDRMGDSGSASEFRSRTNSSTSSSSDASLSSNSETMSLGSTSSSPPDVERNQAFPRHLRKRPNRCLPQRPSRERMSTIQSFSEEDHDTGIDTLGEETSCETEAKPHAISTKRHDTITTQDAISTQEDKQTPEGKPTFNVLPHSENHPPEETLVCVRSSSEQKNQSDKHPAEEKPHSQKTTAEEKNQPEIAPESLEKRFNVLYLVSTIISPPLKPKHVKECLKQYQKNVDKAMKKSTANIQHYQKALLILNARGVMIMDEQSQTPQAFYERETISGVQSHPAGKCAFGITTRVSGNTKHKCHLFIQDKEPICVITKAIQTYIS